MEATSGPPVAAEPSAGRRIDASVWRRAGDVLLARRLRTG
jgi:hypothetical protein